MRATKCSRRLTPRCYFNTRNSHAWLLANLRAPVLPHIGRNIVTAEPPSRIIHRQEACSNRLPCWWSCNRICWWRPRITIAVREHDHPCTILWSRGDCLHRQTYLDTEPNDQSDHTAFMSQQQLQSDLLVAAFHGASTVQRSPPAADVIQLHCWSRCESSSRGTA